MSPFIFGFEHSLEVNGDLYWGICTVTRLGPSQGSICSKTKLLYLAGPSCFLQWNSTKATLSVAAGETLFPSLACKCCSVSVKSPDISSWKNPNPCVRTELKYLPGQRQNGWTLVQSLLEGSLSSYAWKKRKKRNLCMSNTREMRIERTIEWFPSLPPLLKLFFLQCYYFSFKKT